MDVRLIEGMMERIAPLIKQYTEGATQRALEPVKESIGQVALRLGALEDIGQIKGEKGDPGASVTVDDVAPLIASEVDKAVASLPAPKDGVPGEKGEPGLSVTVDDVAPLINEAVVKAVSSLPPPKDGSPGVPGEKGERGESVTVDDVAPLINEAVAKAVSSLPPPKDGARGEDGKSITVDELAPVISDVVAKAVAALPPPKDGAPGRDGSNGNEGPPGKQGEPGPPGDIAFAPTDLAERVASAVRLLAESPAPVVAAVVSQPITIDLKGTYTKREFKFERDANNRVIRAVEEAPL